MRVLGSNSGVLTMSLVAHPSEVQPRPHLVSPQINGTAHENTNRNNYWWHNSIAVGLSVFLTSWCTVATSGPGTARPLEILSAQPGLTSPALLWLLGELLLR